MLLRRVVSCFSVGLIFIGGCDAPDDEGVSGFSYGYSGELLPLPRTPDDFQFDYLVDLRVVDSAGAEVMGGMDLPMTSFGVDGYWSYVAPCTPGESRVEVAVHDFVDFEGAPVTTFVTPASVSAAFLCVGDADAEYTRTVEMATRVVEGEQVDVAFSDVTCTVSRSCGSEGVRADVACTRPNADGLGVSLGLVESRLVCDSDSVPVAPIGTAADAALPVAGVETRAVAGIDVQTWSVKSSTVNRPDCRLEASLVAAPELVGGRPPSCTIWPVVQVTLPLSTARCGQATVAGVGYVDANETRAAVVIDARGPHAPAEYAAVSCGRELSATFGTDDVQGFVDVGLTVRLPKVTEAPARP